MNTENNQQFDATGESGVVANFIDNKSVVFDVGANIGNWSKTVLEKYSNIELHIFEPVPDNYKQINKNLDIFLEAEKIYTNQIAVSNHQNQQTFYYYKDNPPWSTFHRRLEVEREYKLNPPIELPVLTTTIDKYCQQSNINRINFLKIDVKGGELETLYGAKNLLNKGKIDYIQFEYGGTFKDANITLEEVFKYLQKFSYFIIKIEPEHLTYIPEFLPEYENFRYSNYLAVNERFRTTILGQKPEMLPLRELCENNSIKPRGVIHIGAHEGKELTDYLAMGVGKILYVEANPEVFNKLQKQIANYPQVQAVCCAISNKSGTANLHITSMDQSSYILPLKKSLEIYPMIQETEQITVTCKTLDSLIEELNLNPSDFNLLNIDIQGAELLALKGACKTLQYIEAINTEVNYEELYAGCALIDEIDEFLEKYDFTRIATTTPYHPSWGDAFYIKKPIITMSTLGINGRFANQIFQYAFLKIYAQEHNLKVETPNWIGKTIFGHNDPPISQQLPVLVERTNNIKDAIIPNSDQVFKNVDFWGYFQYHTEYYKPYQEYFRSLFRPISEVKNKLEKGLNNLRKYGNTIVGLHLRRGDYGYQHFFVAPNQWYLEWLENIWSTLEKPVLFIASDEIEKVKHDFSKYSPVTAKDLDCEIQEAEFYPDFYFLSKCDILAISNSSFSFVAAMLNENGQVFMRPHLPSRRLITFNPWFGETLFRDAKAEHYRNQKHTDIQSDFKTPIAFIIFNRPDTTARVFEAIRQAKPQKLLVIADGPRIDKPGEAEKCAAVREIINQVDWECEVLTNYSDVNLGGRRRQVSGYNWVFEQVEEAIILEDDCLPHPTFFRYCQELLEKYRDDKRIMFISGNNFQFGRNQTEYSYYFSRYSHNWGWASWRRAWKLYDDEMKLWEEIDGDRFLFSILDNDNAVRYWKGIFSLAHSEQMKCGWDYRFLFACWVNNGLCILPSVNLISNIGFGVQASNTKNENSPLANMKVEDMNFPIQHPPYVIRNNLADNFTELTIFSGGISELYQSKISNIFHNQLLEHINNNENESVVSLIKSQGVNNNYYYIKALAEARLGDITQAKASLNQLLLKCPDHLKGKILFNQLIQKSDKEVEILMNQALNYFNQGEKVKALRLAEKAASVGVFVPGLHYLRSVFNSAVARYEEALEAANLELKYNPQHIQAQEAVSSLTKALLKPKKIKIPNQERKWNTSLPFDIMMSIQNSLHNYSYAGVPIQKNPFDFAIYPVLIWYLKPQTIIEIGSKSGGSALWFGDLLNNFNINGHIYSLDIVKVNKYSHSRVTFLEGDGQNLEETFSQDFIKKLPRPLLIIEDADHSYKTSKAVLDFFHPYLDQGEYIVVEDGIISDILQDKSYNSGPHQALKHFLEEHNNEYDIDDEYCDFFFYNSTWATNGYLKKITPCDITPDFTNQKSSGSITKLKQISNKKWLNLGCGGCFHPDWTNVDFHKTGKEVIAHNLLTGIPFADDSFEVVYHSHLLEHLPKNEAEAFLQECYRVLDSKGIIRVVVPDLEQITRLYLASLEKALQGSQEDSDNYNWLMLEMYDQVVRNESGGEIKRYLAQNPLPNSKFIIERLGVEGEMLIQAFQGKHFPYISLSAMNPNHVGQFRQGGEVHQWMYDRYSLAVLLQKVGFTDIKVCQANESRIPGFYDYYLDVLPNGNTRKSDSLFMEAMKPGN